MKYQTLLSVIVPCFNVEKYIDRCVASIVGQTYVNMEILLIDDGSTDSTGKLCDEWQVRDSRIKVIHKQHEGSSYARKTGVENATAEYVTFVDADDWLDTNMYTEMMSVLLSTDSDIAQCGLVKVFEGDDLKSFDNEKNISFEIVERTMGVVMVLKDEYNSSMCNKIFRKHLFEHVVFPKNRSFGDDISIVFLLFHHASQSVYIHRTYYFYYQSEDSICRAKRKSDQVKQCYYDYSDSVYDCYLFAHQHPEYHDALPYLKHKVITLCLQGLRTMAAYPHFFPDNLFEKFSKRLNAMPFSWKDLIFRLSNPIKITELLVLKTSSKFYKSIVSFFFKGKFILSK